MVRGMPRAWLAAPIASAVACSSGAGRPPPPRPPSPAAPLLAVPRGETPAIDGVVDHAEWAGAAVVTLGQGANLRVMHDGASVYLALSGLDVPDAMAFACVFVADPDRVAVHHASAKLGSAAYTPDATGAYQPAAKTYEWRDPDAMLREEGWTASTVGPDRKQQELALAFARLGLPGEPRPIAHSATSTSRPTPRSRTPACSPGRSGSPTASRTQSSSRGSTPTGSDSIPRAGSA
jgi:hypothetical protein